MKWYPRINGNDLVHRVVVEKALGKPLPKGAVVHHVDYNRQNNENSNLVVCDRRYHALIHQRQDAVNAGYPAHYRKCKYCQNYDDPKNMKSWSSKDRPNTPRHTECFNTYYREYRQRKKGTPYV